MGFNIYEYSLDDMPIFLTNAYGELNPGFRKVCRLYADLSGLSGMLRKRKGSSGPYWTIDYDLAIKFGGTEFQAFVQWTEKGKQRVGPASVIP